MHGRVQVRRTFPCSVVPVACVTRAASVCPSMGAQDTDVGARVASPLPFCFSGSAASFRISGPAASFRCSGPAASADRASPPLPSLPPSFSFRSSSFVFLLSGRSPPSPRRCPQLTTDLKVPRNLPLPPSVPPSLPPLLCPSPPPSFFCLVVLLPPRAAAHNSQLI